MKIQSIQYLRAMAALMVVVSHALIHPLSRASETHKRLGSFGVLLFFVISGFIMVHTTGKGRFAPGDFLRRRIERIVPLYWLVTLAVAIVAVGAPQVLKHTTFSWQQLVGSLLFIPHMRENGEIVPLMKLGWTLNYEIFFYLVFAAFSQTSAGKRTLLVTTLFGILVTIGALFPFEAAIPIFYTQSLLFTFCVGMGIGLLRQHGSRWTDDSRMIPLWLAGSALFIGMGFALPSRVPLGPVTDTFFTLASGSLIMLSLCAERHIPNWRFGLTLGDASYTMYLVHMFFVAGSIILIRRVVGIQMPLLDVASAVTVTVVISLLVHRFVEKPIAGYLRRFDLRRRRPLNPAT